MSIGKKLNIAFSIVIILLIISTVLSFLNLSNIDNKTTEAFDVRVETVRSVENIMLSGASQGLFARALVIDYTPNNEENFVRTNKELNSELDYLETLIITQQMRDYYEQLRVAVDGFNEDAQDFLAAIRANDAARAKDLVINDLQRSNKAITDITNEILAFQEKELEKAVGDTNDAILYSQITAAITLLVVLAVSIASIIFIRRAITKPLVRIVGATNIIATGDLTPPDMPVTSKDEIGQLATAFNMMKGNLHRLIGNVQSNTEQLSAAAEQLSASTEQVTATTNDVAHRIANTAEGARGASRAANESAKAMEETAVGVQRIAEFAQTLYSTSEDARHTARNGNDIIEQAQQQMVTINDSTTQVNELVQKLAKQTAEITQMSKVITDITDQTNLLALNAAIEAARAGEHGKGFAVVADEVRKLAEESKVSAETIVSLTTEIAGDTTSVERAVNSSLHSVKDGVRIIGDAGQAFQAIGHAVEKMTAQIEEVSATSEELSASAEQVSASVHEIAVSSDHASADTEMIAAAMEEQSATMDQVSHVAVSLSENAQQLQQEIQQFRL